MNWRRGLLLAGIHLAVAGTLMVWLESEYWPHIRSEAVRQRPVETEQMGPDGEVTISFNPCDEGGGWHISTPSQASIAGIANLPVALLSGWHTPCTSATTPLESVAEKHYGRTRKSEVVILTILCAGVAVQWFFVGGFPLMKPRRWWWEPGAFITLCTLAAFVLVLIPGIRELSPFLMLFAVLAWLFWFGLLVWKALKLAWRLVGKAARAG